MSITKEEIVKFNEDLGGVLVRPNSLDYALSMQNDNNKFKSCAYLIRAIIIDHVFIDYSKSTCVAICLKEIGDPGDEKLSRFMLNIAKNNISNVNLIEKKLRRCYQKN